VEKFDPDNLIHFFALSLSFAFAFSFALSLFPLSIFRCSFSNSFLSSISS
jgi:hypothetical protein